MKNTMNAPHEVLNFAIKSYALGRALGVLGHMCNERQQEDFNKHFKSRTEDLLQVFEETYEILPDLTWFARMIGELETFLAIKDPSEDDLQALYEQFGEWRKWMDSLINEHWNPKPSMLFFDNLLTNWMSGEEN